MEWYNTSKVLEQYRERMQELMEANLANTRIIENSTFILEVGENTFEITFHTLDYYKYIESGRRAGAKMPPVSAISDWITRKRIVPRPIGKKLPTLPQLAFLIARKIGRDGIPAKPYIKDIQTNMLGDIFNSELTTALTQDISLQLDEFFCTFVGKNIEM